MADEKDPELEQLRRLLAPMSEERLSRIQKTMKRLTGRKIKNDPKPEKDKDAA